MIVDNSIIVIDEMWHTFILFTRDYHNFCYKYFSRFIHHTPLTYLEKKDFQGNLLRNKKNTILDIKNKQKNLLEYLLEIFGKETVIKWYIHYGTKYTKEILFNKLKRI